MIEVEAYDWGPLPKNTISSLRFLLLTYTCTHCDDGFADGETVHQLFNGDFLNTQRKEMFKLHLQKHMTEGESSECKEFCLQEQSIPLPHT